MNNNHSFKFEKTFQVKGLSCQGCVKTIQDKLNSIPQIKSLNVDLNTGKIKIWGDGSIKIEELQKALEGTSYSIFN